MAVSLTDSSRIKITSLSDQADSLMIEGADVFPVAVLAEALVASSEGAALLRRDTKRLMASWTQLAFALQNFLRMKKFCASSVVSEFFERKMQVVSL